MVPRMLHVVYLLIRGHLAGEVGFLVYEHEKWSLLDDDRRPSLTLPSKTTVTDPRARFIQGSLLDKLVNAIVCDELGVPSGAYAMEQELRAGHVQLASPVRGGQVHYVIYPIDLWVHPDQREPLRERVNGCWITCDQAENVPEIARRLSTMSRHVLRSVRKREAILDAYYAGHPEHEKWSGALRRLLRGVPAGASMDALAKEWLSDNVQGIRHLTREKLDEILDAGDRALNLRVADPHLRYQMQGQGFSWSFFTEKDKQDCHAHGTPVVEIYGILEGRLEVWWKPYYERGTSAWSHRILKTGDWLEVDSLQCHIVHWLTKGVGVAFKAGTNPLAEVGKPGVKGKPPCDGCPCMKPAEVRALESRPHKEQDHTEPEPPGEPEPEEGAW